MATHRMDDVYCFCGRIATTRNRLAPCCELHKRDNNKTTGFYDHRPGAYKHRAAYAADVYKSKMRELPRDIVWVSSTGL